VALTTGAIGGTAGERITGTRHRPAPNRNPNATSVAQNDRIATRTSVPMVDNDAFEMDDEEQYSRRRAGATESRRIQQCAARPDRLSGVLALVAGPVLRPRLALRGGRALAVDDCLVVIDANLLPVQRGVVSDKLCLDPAQYGSRLDERIAPARCPVRHRVTGCSFDAAFAFVLHLLAVVLHMLALVRAALALVGFLVVDVRDVIAVIGGRIARPRITPATADRVRALGGTTLMRNVQLLELGGLLVVLQRFAVRCGGPPMEIGQHRVGRLGHQLLAAFGGRALAAGLLTRLVAELLRAPSPLAMLLGTRTGHDRTVLRNTAVGYSAANGSWAGRSAAGPEPRAHRAALSLRGTSASDKPVASHYRNGRIRAVGPRRRACDARGRRRRGACAVAIQCYYVPVASITE
jgi:hypothetical protein